MLLIGVGSFFLACIIVAGTALSYFAAAGLVALAVRGEWVHRRRMGDRT